MWPWLVLFAVAAVTVTSRTYTQHTHATICTTSTHTPLFIGRTEETPTTECIATAANPDSRADGPTTAENSVGTRFCFVFVLPCRVRMESLCACVRVIGLGDAGLVLCTPIGNHPATAASRCVALFHEELCSCCLRVRDRSARDERALHVLKTFEDKLHRDLAAVSQARHKRQASLAVVSRDLAAQHSSIRNRVSARLESVEREQAKQV